MTDLSPEAQAVLDAANGFNSYSPDDVLNESRWIVAAALRAAAHWVDWESGDPKFLVLAIADELAPESPTAGI